VDSFLITVSQGEMPMKSFLVAIVLIFSLLAVFIFPAYSAESPAWKHSQLIKKLGQGEHYLLKLHQASCAVLIHYDGNIEVLANDANWEDTAVTEQIKIYPDGTRIDLVKGVERKYPHHHKRGYKVYVAKCAPHIDGLPKEVQQRLAGL